MLYFRKEFKKVTKTKNIAIFIILKNENKNRKTVSTNLFAKRPLLMVIIGNQT
jgi:hypothetical protein